MSQAAQSILLYAVMPLWLAAGLLDWGCHRRTGIAHTSGPTEAWLHVAMVIEAGLAVLAALFLEINAGVIVLLGMLLLAHAFTCHWDLHYTHGLREVSPFEQSVHAHMEALPVAAFVLLAASHWVQVLAIFGVGTEAPQWSLVPKHAPLPLPLSVGVVVSCLVFGALPYAEELFRTLKHRPRHAADAPREPSTSGIFYP
jgi:hypothetical protein